MTGYLLSILGIVIAGVLIDIIMPNGQINTFIKSIYSIFVVVILISPLTSILKKDQNFLLNYEDFNLNIGLLNYISTKKVNETNNKIKNKLESEGFLNIDINLNYSLENDEIDYILCEVNLKNLEIMADKQHINKYEFIREIVKTYANLTDEEIIFDE